MPAWHNAIGGEKHLNQVTQKNDRAPQKDRSREMPARRAMREQGFTDGPIVPATAGPGRPHIYHDNLQHHGLRGHGKAHGTFIGSISEIVYVVMMRIAHRPTVPTRLTNYALLGPASRILILSALDSRIVPYPT